MEDYGLALKLLRIHFKYTQREIAEKVGVSHHALSKWENGVNQLDIHALRTICALYNIKTEDFFRIASGEPIEKVFQEKAEINKNKIDKNTRRNLMDCKKCGTPAVDGAVYCHNCGERVDGKKACPICGDLNEQEYKYCIYCGARIDGKAVCKTCGAEHEGTFCPQCGEKSAQTKPSKKCNAKVHNGDTYKGVMRIVTLSLGLFAALTAFIFMFFINFEGGEKSIFYYFGDSFKDMKGVKAEYVAQGGGFKGAVYALMYFETIFGCIIAAATLISVATFFGLTVWRSVRALCGKETRSPMNMVLWTAFSYILGAALLYPFGAGSSMGIKIDYNGATMAGLIICFVTLVLMVACVLVTDFEKFKQRAFVVRVIRNGICIVVGLVAFFMVRNVGMKALVRVSYQSVDVSGTPGVIGAFFLGMFGVAYSGNAKLNFEMNMISVFGIIGTTLALVAIVFALLTVFRSVRSLLGENRKTDIVSPIVSAVLSIGVLICCILIWKEAKLIVSTTKSNYTSGIGIKAKYALSILAIVFTVINLGVAIANKIVAKKHEEIDGE